MKNVAEVARERQTVFLGVKTGREDDDIGACDGADRDKMMAVRTAAGLAVTVRPCTRVITVLRMVRVCGVDLRVPVVMMRMAVE